MSLLLDLLPIILFFLAYKIKGIYTATALAIAASLAHLLWRRYTQGRFEAKPLYTFLVIAILGGATLFFQNLLFIKWKPTILYWIFSLALFLTPYLGKEPLIQTLLKSGISLPQKQWQQLNGFWSVFFLMMGVLNLMVVYTCDTDTWVSFKLFGTLIITLVFILLQGLWLMKHGKTLATSLDES